MERTEEQQAIEELAECIKELTRIIQGFPNFKRLLDADAIGGRLAKVYQKATRAKDRMPPG